MKWDEILPLILAGISGNPNAMAAIIQKRSQDKQDEELLNKKAAIAQQFADQKEKSDLKKDLFLKSFQNHLDMGDNPDFGSDMANADPYAVKWTRGGVGGLPITPIAPSSPPSSAPPASTSGVTTVSNDHAMAVQWAKANPNDPRSAKILAINGVK